MEIDLDNDQPTILIVDDERINRALLRSYLEITYSNVLEASDGIKALNMLKKNDVTLVLLDLMMPNMDGYEVLRIMRGHPKFQTIPVVVVTALSNDKDNAKAIECGADAFLTKPFNKVVLSALTKNLLKQGDMQKSLIEARKNDMYYATVVTANHEINQPLTEILCSINLLRLSYADDQIKDLNKFKSYINNIFESSKKISDTLKKLRSVKHPYIKTYVDSIKMVDIDNIQISDAEILKSGKGKEILIIDEELTITDLIKDFFHNKGFGITKFSDYNNVLEEYKKAPSSYDVLVIDIMEPKKAGLELFYELKDFDSDVKVILTSEYDLKDEIVEAIQKGAKAFLPKPYDMDNLLFLLNKALMD